MRTRHLLAGAALIALLATATAIELMAALPRDRSIAFTNIHTKETISVQYVKGGKYVPEAMERINWVLRDWRKDEATSMDTALIDLIWEVHTELGSAEPVHIISGYRSRATNDMLRRTVGGQASESRHILGKAADVYFPDVPLRRLRYSALIRERGGVGYYPTSATPFVHLDTDRVRHWPRLPRFELALLFPSGRSRHQPADGGPITTEDVRIAQARHQSLAVQVAEFMGSRRDPAKATLVAAADPTVRSAARPAAPATARPQVALLTPAPPAATPPAPQLVAEPRLIDRPSRLAPRPSEDDRSRLSQLFTLASLGGDLPKLVREPQPAQRPGRAPTLPSLTGGSAPIALGTAAEPAERRVAAIAPKADPRGSISDLDGWSNGWVQAPAYDDEHPEELSYRPFPITPYLTETASADDAALTQLTHPDVARTLDLLDQAGSMPPMRLLPGHQQAQLLWAQAFRGAAVASDTLTGLAGKTHPQEKAAIADRRVRTSTSR